MISLEEGAKRHEKLFPHTDLQSQMYKLEEELKEYEDADNDVQKLKELSDCIIVCWGLFRFCPRVSNELYCMIMSRASIQFSYDEILEQAEKKWLINEGRTWKFDGKVYHHVGKDGNE